MSARIPEEDACHRARNWCFFSRVQKGTPGLTHKECALQRVSLGALSDVMVVLGMRQSICAYLFILIILKAILNGIKSRHYVLAITFPSDEFSDGIKFLFDLKTIKRKSNAIYI